MSLAPSSRRSTALALASLALSAAFLASGTNSVIAARLWPTGLPRAAAATSDLEPLPGVALPDRCAILARDIFDTSVGPLCPAKAVADLQPPKSPAALPRPGELPPACEGEGRKLVAAVHSERSPEWSLAAVSNERGESLLLRRGARWDDDRIFAIYPRAVVLAESSGAYCSLTFATDAERGRPSTSPSAPTSPIAPAEPALGITAVSDTEIRVTRAAVDRLFTNQLLLSRTIRMIPHEVDGQVAGVKLYGIRGGSAWSALGLKNGDLLRAVDGAPLVSAAVALEAYARLPRTSQVSLAIERRGRSMTLTYVID